MKITEEISWWRRSMPLVAGIDEAGRGPWAGPVTAAAVVFAPHAIPDIIRQCVRDSKQLSPAERDYAFDLICTHAHAWAAASVSSRIIDAQGILPATQRAMTTAIKKLHVTPDILLTDAVSLPIRAIPQRAIIHGDIQVLSIAAASIIAKVTRDRVMQRMARQYPHFSFNEHKGYGTAAHMTELRMHGPTAIHRMSFAPVAASRAHIQS